VTDPTQLAVPAEVVESFKSIAGWAAASLGGMAGVFGLVMRWMMVQIEKRDATNQEAIKGLRESEQSSRAAVASFQSAVETWKAFETEERATHAHLLQTQQRIADAFERMERNDVAERRDLRERVA
jgi:hypothetical protein